MGLKDAKWERLAQQVLETSIETNSEHPEQNSQEKAASKRAAYAAGAMVETIPVKGSSETAVIRTET